MQLRSHSPPAPNMDAGLDATFAALADPTRRKNLARLASGQELALEIDSITSHLRFNVSGDALGFVTQLPDTELREGPDNLWALRDDLYWLIECKKQVDPDRKEINKSESGQMNNFCAWFKEHYTGVKRRNVLIIWTRTLNHAAAFNDEVGIMTKKHLDHLANNTKSFFDLLKGIECQSISETKIQTNLELYHLSVDQLVSGYIEQPKYGKT